MQGITFTHKALPLDLIGKFHIDPEFQKEKLGTVKASLGLDELFYLSTCNRVEFLIVAKTGVLPSPAQLIAALELDINQAETEQCENAALIYTGEDAVRHLFEVSASLDSMVIGEREIITQVRKAHEECRAMGLSGDTIRLVIRKTVETAKQIFTETDIFKKPVSVVSLGFHRLKEHNLPDSSRVLMIGAGKTNRAMAKFLIKHGYKNLFIFNRSIERAEELANDVGGEPHSLSELENFKGGFDVMITCTASSDHIVDQSTYEKLTQNAIHPKVIIDLAIPSDISPEVIKTLPTDVRYIDIAELKTVADKNLSERAQEIEKCQAIIAESMVEFHAMYNQRKIEIAMSDIPKKVKEIRENALTSVYAKEIDGMDKESREVLDKVIAYMEKKYISVPMKMAREVILNQSK